MAGSGFGTIRNDLTWTRRQLDKDSLSGKKVAVIGGTGDIGVEKLGTAGPSRTFRRLAAASGAERHGLRLTHDEALAVLESIASTPGIVGITARFAKSRLHISRRF